MVKEIRLLLALLLLTGIVSGLDSSNTIPSDNIRTMFLPPSPQINTTFEVLVSAKYDNNETVIYGFTSVVNYSGTCSCSTCRITTPYDNMCDCSAGPDIGPCYINFNVLGKYDIQNSTTVNVTVSPYVSLTGINFWPHSPSYTISDNTTTVWVDVNNSKPTSRELIISVGETDNYDRFDVSYNTSFWPRRNNMSSFPVEVTVKPKVKPGTYRLTVSVTSERTTSENVNIVVPVEENLTINEVNVIRYIDINAVQGESDITLRIVNKMPGEVVFDLRETIPKTITNSLADVTFIDYYSTLVEADPIVMWRIELHENQTRDLMYILHTSLTSRLDELPAPELIMLSMPDIPTPTEPGEPAEPGTEEPQEGGGWFDFLGFLGDIDPLPIGVVIIIIVAVGVFLKYTKRKKKEGEVWPTRSLESYRDEIENW